MRTLLLADDSLTVQRVIALTFAEEPIQVVTVSDGRQAMEKMAAVTPDIVLAGTSLPHLNGYELAAFMRGKRELHNVPVLLLTGAFESVDQGRFAKSGANGVIEKPVEPKAVISRVKELLGLKAEEKPAVAGRLVTAPDTGSERKSPPADPLDAAFDKLDDHLSGRAPAARTPRNPAGPLGPSNRSTDPRSPGRAPAADGSGGTNPVFEVDTEWFGGAERPSAANGRADQREIAEDLKEPDWQPQKAAPVDPIYEVDDEWFGDGNKPRAAKQVDRRALAEQMGVHDVDLPERPPAAPAPEFKEELSDLGRELPAPRPALDPKQEAKVAEDFAHLLAYEQGERKTPPAPEVHVVTPTITPEMLDEIASRVAERLNESVKESMTSAVRDTVRNVVSETSERLVRQEIDRIRNKKS